MDGGVVQRSAATGCNSIMDGYDRDQFMENRRW